MRIFRTDIPPNTVRFAVEFHWDEFYHAGPKTVAELAATKLTGHVRPGDFLRALAAVCDTLEIEDVAIMDTPSDRH
jgi:hypothetical protein